MATSTMRTSIGNKAFQSGTAPVGMKGASLRAPVRAVPRRGNNSPVVASASQGPNDMMMKTFGAIAAAQLAFLPVGPSLAADTLSNGLPNPLPKTATSQAARDALNKKTSELPTLSEVGEALTPGSGGAQQALNKASNAAPSLSDAKSAADKAGKKIQNNLPDLSLGKDVTSNDIKNVGKDAKGTADKLANKASGKLDKVADKVSGKIDNLSGKAEGAASKATGKAKGLFGQASNSFTDVADLPSPGELADKVSGKASKAADQISGKASKVADKVSGDLDNATGKAQGVADKAAGKAQGAANKAKNNLPDVADLPSPGEVADKVSGKVSKAADQLSGKASKVADKVSGDLDNATGKAQGVADEAAGKAQGAANKAKNNLPDVADLPSPGEVADKVSGKASKAADQLSGKASKVADKVSGDLDNATGKAQGVADKAAGKAQGAANKAKSNLPDVADLPQEASNPQADVALFGFGGPKQAAQEAVNKASDVGDKVASKAEGVNLPKVSGKIGSQKDATGETARAGAESLEKSAERVLKQAGEASENIGVDNSGGSKSVYGIDNIQGKA